MRPICRPKVNQRVMYDGHKRLKYQSVSEKNTRGSGRLCLIAHLFGPVEGRRHDSFLLRESGLQTEMERHSHDPQGNVMCVYGDPAYPLRAHLQCPFKGANLTEDQRAYNQSMSSARVSIEWVFGDIVNNFKFIDFKKKQQVCLSACGKMYLVAGLITNAHTCLFGNATSHYFGLPPPSLEEYFA